MFSRRPGVAEEDGIRKVELDTFQEPPARGGVGDMGVARAAFRLARVELANDTTIVVPDESTRVSFVCKDARILPPVVDSEFDGLNTEFVAEEGLEARIASKGEASLGTVFPDDKAGPVLAVEQVRIGEELARDDTLDLELSSMGILESGPSITLRIEHGGYFVGRNVSS